MSATKLALLPPLQAGESWGGVLFTSDSRALPPPNLPLRAGGGAKAGLVADPREYPSQVAA
jgi:hypothetical protein